MTDHGTTSPSTLLLTFLAGAAVGALVVGLTTPKTGAEVREDLKALGRKVRRKAGDLADSAEDAWDDLKSHGAMAADDLRRGVREAAEEFRA